MSRFVAFLEREGSMRALALMRIGTGLLLWSRFARELMPFRELEPDRLVLSGVFYVLSTCMVFGIASRVTMPLCAVMMAVMVNGYGERSVEDWGHHHTTLHMLAVWWLCLAPSGRSLSVDRWWAIRAAEAKGEPSPSERGPVWPALLLAMQVATLYLWSLVDKVSNGFYSGVQMEQISMRYYFGSAPPEALSWIYPPLAWSVLALELLLPIALFVRRWQWWAMALGIVMHALFYILIPVNTFSMQMLVLYLAFLDPDEVHAAIDRLLGAKGRSV